MSIDSVVRVLLVEDEQADALLVQIHLGRATAPCFEVTVVGSLSDGVLCINTSPIDAVLLDLSLPDSFGVETIRSFRLAVPDLPVVVLTGFENRDVGLQAIKEGCQDYLVKGHVDADSIAKAVLYSIERKRLERELFQAKERYRLLVDSLPDPVLVCTAGQVQFVNNAARGLICDLPAEQEVQSLSSMVVPRYAQQVKALMDDVIGGGRQSGVMNTQFMATDGRLIDVEIIVLAITHEGARAAEVVVHDLTARYEVDRYRTMAMAVFAGATEAMIVTDAGLRVLMVNPAFTKITGYQPQEIVGLIPHVLLSGEHSGGVYGDMWQTLLDVGYWRGDVWNRRKTGEVDLHCVTVSAICNHDGLIENLVYVFSDVTEQRQKEDTVRHCAFHDALTALPNRVLLNDRLGQAIALACRSGGGVAVLFLDLDEFKPINDRHGHHVGDELLQYVARQLESCVREVDTVARIGGDEFVIVLTDVVVYDDIGATAQAILDAVRQPVALGGALVSVDGSIGIAVFPEDGDDPESLLVNADAAMYRAKKIGSGAFCFFGDLESEPERLCA